MQPLHSALDERAERQPLMPSLPSNDDGGFPAAVPPSPTRGAPSRPRDVHAGPSPAPALPAFSRTTLSCSNVAVEALFNDDGGSTAASSRGKATATGAHHGAWFPRSPRQRGRARASPPPQGENAARSGAVGRGAVDGDGDPAFPTAIAMGDVRDVRCVSCSRGGRAWKNGSTDTRGRGGGRRSRGERRRRVEGVEAMVSGEGVEGGRGDGGTTGGWTPRGRIAHGGTTGGLTTGGKTAGGKDPRQDDGDTAGSGRAGSGTTTSGTTASGTTGRGTPGGGRTGGRKTKSTTKIIMMLILTSHNTLVMP